MTWQKCKSWLAISKALLVFILLFQNETILAQIDEPQFFQRVNTIYYSLEFTDLNNFSSWISSNVFKQATDGFYSTEVFPLEIIWVKSNDLYFIRRSLPQIADSSKNKIAIAAQADLQKEIRALLIDWSRFYAGRLLENMPVDYNLKAVSDTVILKYENADDPDSSRTEMYFGRNGIVLETRVISRDSTEIIYTFPEYKYTGEYWLCSGWRVQITHDGRVDSGFQIKVDSQRIDKYWLPSQLQMVLQTREMDDKIFTRVYKFRNSRINRDIQVLNR